jgi:hypothetical protein
MFYHETVNSYQYVRNTLIGTTFFKQLMSALQEVFNDRIIAVGLSLPRLLDLNVCNFYLWGSRKVYRNTPSIAEPYHNEIRDVTCFSFKKCETCLRAAFSAPSSKFPFLTLHSGILCCLKRKFQAIEWGWVFLWWFRKNSALLSPETDSIEPVKVIGGKAE